MAEVQDTMTREEWLRFQAANHDVADIGELLNDPALKETGGGASPLHPAVRKVEVSGRSVFVREPKVAQVRGLLTRLATDGAAAIQNIESLMLDCLEVTPAPKSIPEWWDSLPASSGLAIAEAWGEVIAESKLVERLTKITSGMRGATAGGAS